VLLDKLRKQDSILSIGISHLKNEKHLGKDEIVRLSSKTRNKILAVQFLNPTFIAGNLHALSAAQNAVNAWFGGYAVSRGLDVEIAVYASGQRQIGPALESMGIRDGMSSLALVVIADNDAAVKTAFEEIARSVGTEMIPAFPIDAERKQKILEHFGIKETELSALSQSDDPNETYRVLCRCVASRVSMVAIET